MAVKKVLSKRQGALAAHANEISRTRTAAGLEIGNLMLREVRLKIAHGLQLGGAR